MPISEYAQKQLDMIKLDGFLMKTKEGSEWVYRTGYGRLVDAGIARKLIEAGVLRGRGDSLIDGHDQTWEPA